MHILLAPDSFKGSAAAGAVADAVADGLAEALPDARVTRAPMADGGEGTLDCVASACPGRWHRCRLAGIHGRVLDAPWYERANAGAVIESASVLGLPLIEAMREAPPLAERGSHALGVLLGRLLDQGLRDITIGLGGSACNDAGLGLLIALGARAVDARGQPVAPSMNGLLALAAIDLSGLDARLAACRLTVLCDVDSPLLGAAGASRVYGPQKGLGAADIDAVEAAFARLAARCGAEAATALTGSGAAGGLGFALAAIGGRLEPGAAALMRVAGLPALLADADLVITGEGRSDAQTLTGKVPLAVAQAAAPRPVILLSGAIDAAARAKLARHFAACHTLVERAGSIEAARAEPLRWLRAAGREIGRSAGAIAGARTFAR